MTGRILAGTLSAPILNSIMPRWELHHIIMSWLW